jgi:hypothetical protein
LDLDVAENTNKGVRKFQFTFFREGEDHENVKLALLEELHFPLIHASFRVPSPGDVFHGLFQQYDGLTEDDYKQMRAAMLEDRQARQAQYDQVAADNAVGKKPTGPQF